VKRTASRKPQTIRIVVEQAAMNPAARPDITAEALAGAQLEVGKRRARL